MAITRKPQRPKATITTEAETAAARFINEAETSIAADTPQRRATMAPVLLRFDERTLRAIDFRASKIGLSRAAWVRMVVAHALDES